jgi:predicted O-methyltransferase YrrM
VPRSPPPCLLVDQRTDESISYAVEQNPPCAGYAAIPPQMTSTRAINSQGELERTLEGVPGWFVPREAWILHEAIRRSFVERAITVVEIGSFRGRSTIAAAHALLARAKGGKLYAIDPQADEGFRELEANIAEAGVESVVELIRATSREARKRFDEGPVDLLFIDGSHEYEDVRGDFGDWLPLVEPGGIVAVNDPFWWGVGRALRERLTRGGALRRPRLANNTIFFTYLPAAPWSRRDRRELVRLRVALALGRLGGSTLAATGATRLLPDRLKSALLGVLTRGLGRVLAWVVPSAAA